MANPTANKEVNKTQNNNPAAPDNGQGVPNDALNKRTIVALDGRGNPIVSGSGTPPNLGVASGEGPNQAIGESKIGGTPQGGTAGDNPKQGSRTVGTAAAAAEQQDTGVDIDKLITESTGEIKTADEALEAKKKKSELLTRAINSRMYMENITFKNVESDEFVGSKMRYYADPYGKSVYDYMNDPEVTNHIGFKVPEGDPKDGSPVEEQITIYWVNPVF